MARCLVVGLWRAEVCKAAGIVAAPGMDVPTPSQEPLPTFIGMFAGVLFFAFGAHHSVLAAFSQSYTIVGAGAGTLSVAATETLVGAVSALIEVAVRMAAPFIALNFVITLGFSVLGRAVPKMNVFILSYSLRSMVGFLLLAGAGTLLARYMSMAFEKLPWQMLELVGTRY